MAIAFVVWPICHSYYLIGTMATPFIQSKIISFDQNIFTVINYLKQKQKRTDTDTIL